MDFRVEKIRAQMIKLQTPLYLNSLIMEVSDSDSAYVRVTD